MATCSDHIFLWIETRGGYVYIIGKRPFIFKAMWVGNEDYAQIIAKT